MYYIENHKLEKLADFIFPSNTYCISCGKFIDKSATYSICDFCMDKIQWGRYYLDIEKYQRKTGFDLSLDGLYSSSLYGSFTRAIVQDFKDNRRTYLARTIGEILWERVILDPACTWYEDIDYIVPAPSTRGEKRGFNQCEKIARYFSKHSGIPVLDILEKTSSSESQRGRNLYERMMGVEGKVSVKECDITGKNILIIDDVMTTGATINECAKVLKKKGALSTRGLVFSSRNKYITCEPLNN